jgi:hypothetical protein
MSSKKSGDDPFHNPEVAAQPSIAPAGNGGAALVVAGG